MYRSCRVSYISIKVAILLILELHSKSLKQSNYVMIESDRRAKSQKRKLETLVCINKNEYGIEFIN